MQYVVFFKCIYPNTVMPGLAPCPFPNAPVFLWWFYTYSVVLLCCVLVLPGFCLFCRLRSGFDGALGIGGCWSILAIFRFSLRCDLCTGETQGLLNSLMGKAFSSSRTWQHILCTERRASHGVWEGAWGGGKNHSLVSDNLSSHGAESLWWS